MIVGIQEMLNVGRTNGVRGKVYEISEAAVRYYLKKGDLKKSLVRILPNPLTASHLNVTVPTLPQPKTWELPPPDQRQGLRLQMDCLPGR